MTKKKCKSKFTRNDVMHMIEKYYKDIPLFYKTGYRNMDDFYNQPNVDVQKEFDFDVFESENIIVWYLNNMYCIDFSMNERTDSIYINNRNIDELKDLERFLKRTSQDNPKECSLCFRTHIVKCADALSEKLFTICSRCNQGICIPCIYKLQNINHCSTIKSSHPQKNKHSNTSYSCPFCKKNTHLPYESFDDIKKDVYNYCEQQKLSIVECPSCTESITLIQEEYPEYEIDIF